MKWKGKNGMERIITFVLFISQASKTGLQTTESKVKLEMKILDSICLKITAKKKPN